MTLTREQIEAPEGSATPSKRCSDCDFDCYEVENHLKCWSGGLVKWGKKWRVMPIADGLCPFVHEGVDMPPANS
jgi:hypothetical protein